MKRLVLASLAVLGLAGGVSAQPASSAKPAEQCFFTRDLRNHTVGDAHTLYFDVGGRSVYRVETSDNCLSAATSADPIVLRDRSSGQICNKLDLDISVHGARCIISGITKLTPEEASALPRRIHP